MDLTFPLWVLPWLPAMFVLAFCSAVFSASEAALFSLSRRDLSRMAKGNPAERAVVALLHDPDRLLNVVLFWNLVVNLAYFTIASIVSLRLESGGDAAESVAFAVVSLIAMILVSEMLPKSCGVLLPRFFAPLLAIPVSIAVRLLDPATPLFLAAKELSIRVFFPHFTPEPYLRVGDLEKAVELSTTDAALVQQEQRILQNIVGLSDTPVEEFMRPRTRLRLFHPPVSPADLENSVPESGYLLVTEPDSDEPASAVPLRKLSSLPDTHLEHHAQPVLYVPWCTTVAAALDMMRRRDRPVAAVINEYGETVGIVTFDDILDAVFGRSSGRAERLLKRVSLVETAPGVYRVTGMTSLRRLTRRFNMRLPECESVTVAGIIQEVLERLPTPGDVCRWGPFRFSVLEVPAQGVLLAEMTLVEPGKEEA